MKKRAEQDIEYMRLALKLAKKGLGKTSPNPCVGAVIVKDDQVIASGYHKKAGTPHAEIHALREAGSSARGATMYVTLEPCNHTGRTGPCSHAVAEAGIQRVVIGMEDPNPLVDGTGIDYLKAQDIEVVSGVLTEQCRAINRPFIKHIQTGLPWVVMKAGISLDGKLNYQKNTAGWITGEQSKRRTHRLRDRYDAIMVGTNTAVIDNPSLTTRIIRNGKDPLRILLDRRLRLDVSAKIYSVESLASTWVFCSELADMSKRKELERLGIRVTSISEIDGKLQLNEVMRCLGGEGITSILVEGGAQIHGALLSQKLADYAHLFIAPVFAGEEGVSLIKGYSTTHKNSAVSLSEVQYTRLGEDVMVSGEVVYPD